MNYFRRRRARQHLKLLLKQARHVRNMREDVADPGRLRLLGELEINARRAIGASDHENMRAAAGPLERNISSLIPGRPYPGLRDNIETLLVAVAVAMAFRTYFLQPFRIPTSSMHPTLHGITYEPQSAPGLFDRFPLQIARWIVRGQWYVEIAARTSGVARFVETPKGETAIVIGGLSHRVPANAGLRVGQGDRVMTGQVLASGVRTAGDHILVNKVAWNFRRPQRGEIMVFTTDGIRHPQIKEKEHYVKRLVGLPGETVDISDPYLLVNGMKLRSPRSIKRIQDREEDYSGFIKPQPQQIDVVEAYPARLGPADYHALGDNQASSLDSRYWGPVPEENLVGPAVFVYWPFSRRWGPVD